MSVNTKEEVQIKDKLDFIGLDLNDIPDFLTQYMPLEFRPSKTYVEESFKIYKYIDVRDIQILLTPKNRLDSLNERYKLASSFYSYIMEPKTELDIIKHATILKIFKEMNIDKINKVEEEQKKLNNKIPFRVKYEHNYLWQIFYDEYTKQYFMLVTTEDKDYEAFFYLLKEQIKSFKSNKSHKIFVPISYQYYQNDFLKKSEMDDIQKYIWLFTKNWPNIYEVYDKNEKMSLQIIGSTYVYEKIKSPYKIKLESKEETIKFYKLLKALFIMQTELANFYKFETKISQNGGLEFLENGRIIEYDNLSKIIKEDVLKYQEENNSLEVNIQTKEKELENLNKTCSKKEEEYHYLEKQITTYLEYKKTFFGKIRYFFKSKKIKQKQEDIEEIQKEKQEEIKNTFLQKEFYTIEDLIQICKKTDELQTKMKNIQLDNKAMQLKLNVFVEKIENAKKYLKEINDHKKNLFDFWKFTNKNETLGLPNSSKTEQTQSQVLVKTFDYKEDFEELASNMDKMQKEKLTKQECDSIYIASTNMLSYIQKETIQEEELNKIKNDAITQGQINKEETFDIFGTSVEDKTKIKTLANKKHRENKKNMWKILDINQNTSKEEFEEKLEKIKEQIEHAIDKIKLPFDINVYISTNRYIKY